MEMNGFEAHLDADEIFVPSKLQIAVLCPSFAESDSVFKEYVDLDYDFEAFNPKPDQYFFELISIKKSTAWDQMQQLTRSGRYDLFFNLCDGVPETDYAGIEVTEFLEQANVPCISPTKDFYSMSKRRMKFVADACHIPTPGYFFVFPSDQAKLFSTEQVILEAKRLKFPLIVKHHNGSGSEGLSSASKVQDISALLKETEKTVQLYGGALVEEFIAGQEFTVLVAENLTNPERPIVYQPFECILQNPDVFKDFALKIVQYDLIKWAPVLDDKICSDLKFYSAEMYKACGGRCFARCDYRMCVKTGNIYFLEINAQCGVCGKVNEFNAADYILEYKSKKPEFMQNLINCAFSSWNKKNQLDNMDLLDFSEKFAKTKAKIPKSTVLVDLTKFSPTLMNRIEIDQWSAVRKRVFLEKSVRLNDNLFLDFKGAWCHFDMMAFKRAGSCDINAKIDENFRIVTLENLDIDQYVIIEQNDNM